MSLTLRQFAITADGRAAPVSKGTAEVIDAAAHDVDEGGTDIISHIDPSLMRDPGGLLIIEIAVENTDGSAVDVRQLWVRAHAVARSARGRAVSGLSGGEVTTVADSIAEIIRGQSQIAEKRREVIARDLRILLAMQLDGYVGTYQSRRELMQAEMQRVSDHLSRTP